MSSDNVFNLKDRIKQKNGKAKGKGTGNKGADAPIIDMTERRQEIITEERRHVRRTILSSFIGAFCVIPRKGLMKVILYDISENGLSFDLDIGQGQYPVNEELAMRVYLSQDTYFAFTARVQNVRAVDGENVYRHGANFVKGSIDDLALHHFVKFIECISSSLQRDEGDHLARPVGKY